MSTVDLDAIRSRAEMTQQWVERDPCIADGFRPLSYREHFGADVPGLLAEVERLRAELAAEQAAHAKTASNFEEFAEAAVEERDRLRHALDDARLDRLRARQAFIELVNTGAVSTGDGTGDTDEGD